MSRLLPQNLISASLCRAFWDASASINCIFCKGVLSLQYRFPLSSKLCELLMFTPFSLDSILLLIHCTPVLSYLMVDV